MAYRELVDEDVDPSTAERLRERGYAAASVGEIPVEATADPPIADHARERDSLVLTNDADFHRPDRRQGRSVLHVPENAVRVEPVGDRRWTLAAPLDERGHRRTPTRRPGCAASSGDCERFASTRGRPSSTSRRSTDERAADPSTG